MIASAILYEMSGVLSESERAGLLSGLERSAESYLSVARQVPEERWTVAPAEGKWSAAQLAEHLVLVEQQLRAMLRDRLLTSAAVEPSPDQAELDERVPRAVLDPNRKPEAPPSMRPSGRWTTREEALRAFRDERESTIEYIRTTKDPLRAHRVQHSLGNMDGHHWLLLLISHTERHARQMQNL